MALSTDERIIRFSSSEDKRLFVLPLLSSLSSALDLPFWLRVLLVELLLEELRCEDGLLSEEEERDDSDEGEEEGLLSFVLDNVGVERIPVNFGFRSICWIK